MNIEDVFCGLSVPRRALLTKAQAHLLRSGTPQSLLAEGCTLAGWSWGTTGPQVLLVHGWDSRASHLGQFVAPLLRAGFQVWAFDGPAHGDSTGNQSSVVHYGKALLEIEDAYGPFDGLVAHSVGSPSALYAFQCGMRVCSSVHIAGPVSLERLIQRIAQTAGLDAAGAIQLHRLTESHIGRPVASVELDALADGLRHPALLLHDPADCEVPYAESRVLAEAWRGAQLVAIPGAGHRRIIAHPEAIAAAVSHLAFTIPLQSSAAEKVTADE